MAENEEPGEGREVGPGNGPEEGIAGFIGRIAGALNASQEFSIEHLAKLKSGAQGLQGPLNGLLGDKLEEKENPMALSMGIYRRTAQGFSPLEVSKSGLKETLAGECDRVCVFIHGLGSSEKTWMLRRKVETSYAELLKRDTGHSSYFIRYNTGRHISKNGRALAELLNDFFKAYPRKIREINLIGHSMGGLVSRSAGFYGGQARHAWVGKLARNFLLGSPLLGAHQEQIGKLTADVLGLFSGPAALAASNFIDMRSSGIQDLGFGYLRDEDWGGPAADWKSRLKAKMKPASDASEAPSSKGLNIRNRRSPVPLLKNTRYYLIVGSLSKDPESIIGSFLGDGVVNSASAHGSGSANNYEQYEGAVTREIPGLNHVNIPGDPRVYRLMRTWLRE